MGNKLLAKKLVEESDLDSALRDKYPPNKELTAADVKAITQEEIDWMVEHQIMFGAHTDDVKKMHVVYPSEFEFKNGEDLTGYPNVEADGDLVKMSSSLGQGKPEENEVWCTKVFVDYGWAMFGNGGDDSPED